MRWRGRGVGFVAIGRLDDSDEVGARVADRFVAAGLPRAAVRSESPPFGFERADSYGAALAGRIRAHGTTLLLMGVGAPKSELWVDRHAGALGDPVVLAIGEALSVAAGVVPRAHTDAAAWARMVFPVPAFAAAPIHTNGPSL